MKLGKLIDLVFHIEPTPPPVNGSAIRKDLAIAVGARRRASRDNDNAINRALSEIAGQTCAQKPQAM